ncbi:MAG: tetratricopeptide repeat protein [Bacteroidetes bacterium]|nr:tetratricopeptide repeat protein [Bacteroidota bacterium]
MKIHFVLFLSFLLLFSKSFGQSEKQFLKAANEAYEAAQYYEAIAYFEQALKFDKSNEDALYKIAMSHYELKNYAMASKYFPKISDKEMLFPLLAFYAANNEKLQGNYKLAIELFEKFNNSYPIDGFYKKKAQQEIASCYWALDQKLDENQEIIHFESPLNTGYSDFGASYLNPTTLQASTLQADKEDPKAPFLARINFFLKDEENISLLKELKLPISADDTLDYADGYYLAEKKEFYYSKCYMEHELGEKICDLYVRKLEDLEKSIWGEEKSLNINTENFTETQAQLSVDENNKTILYFVSNRSGGKGKLDIWRAEESSFGVFEKLENLPEGINSIDNESTPYFEQSTQELYFSSEWYYGFGGYDIFVAKENTNGFSEALNLGLPINSSANDQYYYPSPDNIALFSSNREGAMQLKGSACCFDIYEHKIQKNIPSEDSLLVVENHLDSPKKATETNLELVNLQNSLPVVVYFHNDEPLPKSMATKTNLSYQAAYESYLGFKNTYVESFENEEAIATWFAEVEASYSDLNKFLELVEAILDEKKLSLIIEGYCSPLALNDYNINLAKRRIVSLENYILQWKDGALKSAFNSGKLVFKDLAFGEEKAADSVSDSYEETKYSIYDPMAAKERRVAIIAVE